MSDTMVANERQQQAVDNHSAHAPPPGVSALPPAPSPPGQAGQAPGPAVIHGTCGWSSTPFPARGAADKLRHYSRHFGCVEVDTSTYAIPRPDVTQRCGLRVHASGAQAASRLGLCPADEPHAQGGAAAAHPALCSRCRCAAARRRRRWAQAAAEGFQFHVKAFGLFCAQGCQVSVRVCARGVLQVRGR
jgi:hypothetical protein